MGIDINTLKREELLKGYRKFLILISCVLYLEFCLIYFVAHSGIMNLDKASVSLSGKGFLKLIWDINSLAQRANSLEKEKWLAENLRAQLIGKIYFYACWVAVICSGIFPLLLMAYDYKQNKKINHKLPFGGKFLGDQGGIFAFIVKYVLSFIYIYGLLNMTVGIDTLYGWYIHSISAHFRILSSKISDLASTLQNSSCVDFKQKINAIVNYHNLTLKLVRDLNVIFGEILWAEVTLSSLQMCFSFYTLNNDNDVSHMPFNFMTIVAVIMQLMIYCFGGEKIRNESLTLSLDLYLMFPWDKMSAAQRKSILLPLMRAQKLCVLRGLFFEVDRSLFVYILKTAFSFNALLSAMKE